MSKKNLKEGEDKKVVENQPLLTQQSNQEGKKPDSSEQKKNNVEVIEINEKKVEKVSKETIKRNMKKSQQKPSTPPITPKDINTRITDENITENLLFQDDDEFIKNRLQSKKKKKKHDDYKTDIDLKINLDEEENEFSKIYSEFKARSLVYYGKNNIYNAIQVCLQGLKVEKKMKTSIIISKILADLKKEMKKKKKNKKNEMGKWNNIVKLLSKIMNTEIKICIYNGMKYPKVEDEENYLNIITYSSYNEQKNQTSRATSRKKKKKNKKDKDSKSGDSMKVKIVPKCLTLYIFYEKFSKFYALIRQDCIQHERLKKYKQKIVYFPTKLKKIQSHYMKENSLQKKSEKLKKKIENGIEDDVDYGCCVENWDCIFESSFECIRFFVTFFTLTMAFLSTAFTLSLDKDGTRGLLIVMNGVTDGSIAFVNGLFLGFGVLMNFCKKSDDTFLIPYLKKRVQVGDPLKFLCWQFGRKGNIVHPGGEDAV